jgi:hypothetical protein
VSKQRPHSLLGAKARQSKTNSVRRLRQATNTDLSTFLYLPLPNMQMGRAEFVAFIFASNGATLLRKFCYKFLDPYSSVYLLSEVSDAV